MSDCGSFPSLQQRALHELAKICWKKVVLREGRDNIPISISSVKESLPIYRKKILNNLPRILNDISEPLYDRFPKKLMGEMINSVINMQKGYYKALSWENEYENYLPLTILNPRTAGKYEASHFIEPTGNFNELAWVKLFVTDERMNVYCRFEMACFYCLEDELTNIWNIMKTKRMLPCAGNLENMKFSYNKLAVFWAYKLENKLDELFGQDSFRTGFYNFSYLDKAIFRGYEYAVQYFWMHCSVFHKAKFLKDFNDFCDRIICAAVNNYSGITHFLYVLFSLKHKNLYSFVKLIRHMGEIWSCLLNSQFYKCVLNDILSFPIIIPIKVYLCILNSLASNIKIFNYPLQKIIFTTLWNHLSNEEKAQVFEESSYIVETFVKIQETDLLVIIIKSLPYSVKDNMLLFKRRVQDKCVLEEISNIYDCDTKLRYVFFFLTSSNSTVLKLSLRGDAHIFLEHLKKNMLIECPRSDTTLKQNFLNILDNIQVCLSILNNILDQISEINL